jgi:hypothetical protein
VHCVGFHCFAEGQGRFFLGVNFRKPLLTGFNERSYTRLWHRGASCVKYPAPCDISTATSSAPDINALQGALLWLPGFRDACDDVRGSNLENGTVVSLDNNVALPLLFAALSAHADDSSYMDCLQGQGALVKHPVCRYKRPLGTRLGPDDVPVALKPTTFRGLWTEAETQKVFQAAAPAPADIFSGFANTTVLPGVEALTATSSVG